MTHPRAPARALHERLARANVVRAVWPQLERHDRRQRLGWRTRVRAALWAVGVGGPVV